MTNQKNVIGKKNLLDYSKNILEFSKYLDIKFPNQILFHFQDHSCEGFEYSIKNNFSATNKLPKKYKKIYSNKKSHFELRFFCNTRTIFSAKDFNKFCNGFPTHFQSPLFFVTPYHDSYNEEYSYIIEPKFEVKLKFERERLYASFINYKEDEKLFNEIKNYFQFSFKIPEKITDLNKNKNYNKIPLDKKIINAINSAKKHMENGDCYLANITTTATILNEKKFITVENFIRSWFLTKSRYGIYYKDNEKALACFSPERFIYSKEGFISTEPIKGTLKSKQKTPTKRDAKKIWANKKEIYEHTLVVDLMRNDLYNVCKPESIIVYRPFYARKSGALIQMQSFIIGKLNEHKNLPVCLAKMLPSGSITGTPKKKVCEIISELETNKRGYYTGVCGILEQNGDFDSTILIRSIYMGERGTYFGVGAGITTLSNTQLEFEEFEIKLNSFIPVFEGLI